MKKALIGLIAATFLAGCAENASGVDNNSIGLLMGAAMLAAIAQ